MSIVRLPSVQVDIVREDHLDATQGVALSLLSEPFNITDLGVLTVIVDGGAPQPIVFNVADFSDIAAATMAEVLLVVGGTLAGAFPQDQGGRLAIVSNTFGSTSSIEITTEPPRNAPTPGDSFQYVAGPHFGVDATGGVFLVNAVPEDGELSVETTASIEFEITDTAGVAPAPAQFQIEVNGVLAYDGPGAGFQPGFGGSFLLVDAATRHVTVTPAIMWDSDAVIVVRVIIGTPAFDETYSFRVDDTTAPGIASIISQDINRIRLTFTDDVLQVDPFGAGDALNPANYFFIATTIPGAAVVPVRVDTVNSRSVDITTDIPLTFGSGYNLTVLGVFDTDENVFVTAPANALDFDAFTPPYPPTRRFYLSEMLPVMNFSEDATGDLRRFVAVIQEVTNLLLYDADRWVGILDSELIPEDMLDAALASLGDPFGRFDLTASQKRQLLDLLVAIYKLKGTGQGIIAVILFFLGIDVAINTFNGEGWELAGESTDRVIVFVDAATPAIGVLFEEVPMYFADQLTVELNGVIVAQQISNTRTSLIGDELNSDLYGDGWPPAILGPDQAGLYSFEVISGVNLTRAQAEGIVFLANYMKPAHTHLLRIIQPNAPDFDTRGLGVPVVGIDSGNVFIDHVELGLSNLGSLGLSAGNFTLH